MLSDTGEVGLLLGNQFLVGARNGRESLTRAPWRGGKSLAVELPQVEFGGARQCPGGRNQSE